MWIGIVCVCVFHNLSLISLLACLLFIMQRLAAADTWDGHREAEYVPEQRVSNVKSIGPAIR